MKISQLLGVFAVFLLVGGGCSFLGSSEVTEEPTDDVLEESGVEVGGAMLLPSLNVVQNAMKADTLTTFVAALDAGDIDDVLIGPGPFTVFAPTNAAFDKLPEGALAGMMSPEFKVTLQAVLNYHVVPGVFMASDLEDGMILTTVLGEDIMFSEDNGMWYVNEESLIEVSDIVSSNGVMHTINQPMRPSPAAMSGM